MQEAAVSPLTAWGSFYVIVGTSAGALTGLMFVVITLIAGSPRMPRSSLPISAFSTPTVVHFGAALFVAALLSAPWQALWHVALLLGLFSLGGVIYSLIVLRRTLLQTDYELVLEDWLGHIIFPLASYIALVVAALLLPGNPVPALFVIAAATILFLFIGIHNAWDTVTYIVLQRSQPENERQD
jgi:hypothetical protein